MPPGLVAGKVSGYRAAHARCPVLAVPPPALADGAARRARLSVDVVPARAATAPLRQPAGDHLGEAGRISPLRAGISRAITDGEPWPSAPGARLGSRRGGECTGTSAKSSRQAATAGRTTPVLGTASGELGRVELRVAVQVKVNQVAGAGHHASAHGGVPPDQRGEDAMRFRAAYLAGRQACTASAVLW